MLSCMNMTFAGSSIVQKTIQLFSNLVRCFLPLIHGRKRLELTSLPVYGGNNHVIPYECIHKTGFPYNKKMY